MNLPGISFNNSNWPYILRAGRRWLLGLEILFPIAYLAARMLFADAIWEAARLIIVLPATLGIFVVIMVAGKRRQ